MRILFSRPRSIRTLLLILSGALVVPLLAGGAYISYEFARAEQSRLEQDAYRSCREMAARLDREIAQMLSVLQTLAISRALDDGDFEGFYQRAALLRSDHANVVVRDRSGQQLVNTRVAWGTPLPKATLDEADQRVLETRRPYVSDIIVETLAGRPQFMIEVPVWRSGEIALFLNMSLATDRLRDVIMAVKLPAGQVAEVIDRKGTFVARSQRDQDFAGTPAAADFVAAVQGREGVWRGVNLEGVPFLAAYARSELSDWIVSIGVPVQALNAPLYRSLYGFALVGAIALALAGSAAAFVGRRVAGSVAALDSIASHLQRRPDFAPLATPVTEVNAVSSVLAAAARQLRSTEARFRSVFEQAAVGIKRASLHHGRILDANDKFCRMLNFSHAELVGRAVEDLTHPDDRAEEREYTDKLLAGEISEYAIDKRYRRKDGTYVWVRLTSSLSHVAGEETCRIATAEEISEQKAYEQHLQFTLRELSHRTKNLLAVVQSMARQTARQSGDFAEFELLFTARVQALARAHDLLVVQNWQGVPLLQLIESQLQPFGDFDLRVDAEGPALTLTPAATQHLALAFHELATNAVKYGALSTPDGRIVIRWSIDPPSVAQRMFRLEWTERNGPTVATPTRRGFGAFVVEKMVGSGLGGQASLTLASGGANWTAEMPLDTLISRKGGVSAPHAPSGANRA